MCSHTFGFSSIHFPILSHIMSKYTVLRMYYTVHVLCINYNVDIYSSTFKVLCYMVHSVVLVTCFIKTSSKLSLLLGHVVIFYLQYMYRMYIYNTFKIIFSLLCSTVGLTTNSKSTS